nr:MAG TPA: hypothetical protein [Caudoviricetes sp.]
MPKIVLSTALRTSYFFSICSIALAFFSSLIFFTTFQYLPIDLFEQSSNLLNLCYTSK